MWWQSCSERYLFNIAGRRQFWTKCWGHLSCLWQPDRRRAVGGRMAQLLRCASPWVLPDLLPHLEEGHHRRISRDGPTYTGSLCLCRPFFYVAALSVRIWRVVNGGWDGSISVEESFWKENKWLIFVVKIVLLQRREVGYFLICADRIQSWADANVFVSSRPWRESILTTRRRATAENDAIAKDATSHRREISRQWH